MFGISPVPPTDQAARAQRTVYQAGIVGALLFGLGLVCLILFLGLTPGLIGSWMSVLVIGVPLLGGTVLGLALGYANLHTRIELSAERVEIVAPSWRGFPAPPLQHLSVALDEIRTIRRRTERLGLGLPGLRLPVDVYAIETARGRVVLGSYYLGELEAVLGEIFARSGCARADDGEIGFGLLQILTGGAARGGAVEPAADGVRGRRPG